MAEKETEARKKFADYVVDEAREGNVVFASLDDYGVAPLDEFIKQPADGILYDLNRLPEVVLTFIDDRWVNDYAVYQVIKRLRELVPEWRPIESVPKDGTEVLLVWQWDSGLDKGVRVVMAAWRCRAHSFLSSDHDCPNEAGCDMKWDSYGGRMTHWMPIPALPDPPEVVK